MSFNSMFGDSFDNLGNNILGEDVNNLFNKDKNKLFTKDECKKIVNNDLNKTLIPIGDPNNYVGCKDSSCLNNQINEIKDADLRINGVKFSSCSNNNMHCIDNLNINRPTNNGSVPDVYSSNTPPTNNFLLRRPFDEISNYYLDTTKTENVNKMPFYDSSLNNLSECRRWCNNNNICHAFDIQSNNNENICYYLNNNDLSNNTVMTQDDTKIVFKKNNDSYIYNLSDKQKNAMYNNRFFTKQLTTDQLKNKDKACSEEFNELSENGYLSYKSSNIISDNRSGCVLETNNLKPDKIGELPKSFRVLPNNFSNMNPIIETYSNKKINCLCSILIIFIIFFLIFNLIKIKK